MSSTEAPPANSAMTLVTGKRIPRMHGLPIMTSGSTVMREKPARVRVIEPSVRRAAHPDEALSCVAGASRLASIHPRLRFDVLNIVRHGVGVHRTVVDRDVVARLVDPR